MMHNFPHPPVDQLAFTNDAQQAGMRLDKLLSAYASDLGLSRTRLKELILKGQVKVDGKLCRTPSLQIQAEQLIELDIPPSEEYSLDPQELPLDVIFEDGDIIVINKAADMVVHPAAGNWQGTLVHALLFHCGESLSGISGVLRPGIVHRLDKGTSGVIVAAKNDQAHQALSQQLSERSMQRTYHALVCSVPIPPIGSIETALDRDSRDRLRMSVRSEGRHALTHYRVIEDFMAASLVECRLQTGRTHQIRVHMEYLGYPLIGDPIYGPQTSKLESLLRRSGYESPQYEIIKTFPRQALHAVSLYLHHPRTGEALSFQAPYPKDIATLIEQFKQ